MDNEYLIEKARTEYFWLIMKSPRDRNVLDVMSTVDRIDFLPENVKSYAYHDTALPIGYNGTCSQPSLVALMADLLELKEGMNVLEVGSGCGYSAVFTKKLIGSGKLTTIEIVPQLAEMARQNLGKHFGSLEIEVVCGDGSLGYPENAPYDRIYLTASIYTKNFDPGILMGQLKDDGLLLFPDERISSLVIYRKKKGKTYLEKQFRGVTFVPLRGRNT